jgi:hypothetical protein
MGCPTPANSSVSDLTNVHGTLFFAANDGTHGVELWKLPVEGSALAAGHPVAPTASQALPQPSAAETGSALDTLLASLGSGTAG